MSTETTDRSGVAVAAALAAPAPSAAERLRDAFASQASTYATDLSRRWTRISRGLWRFARRQTEFNQIARFVLAVPLAVATPSYIGFDARPPAPETASALPRGVPPAGAPQAVVPGPPGTVYRVAPSDPRVQSPADVVAGPRIRAICSRAGQTVFLDDRAEVEASADWREEVALKHPGAVCAFTTRYGVADPQFRAIETNTVAAPAQAAPPPEDRLPIFVKTIPVPSEMLAPPDPRAGGFGLSYDSPDPAKDQIERALAALAAPSPRAGARIAPSAALAASATTPLPEPRPRPQAELRVASADATAVGPSVAVALADPVKTAPREAVSPRGFVATAEMDGWARAASPFRHPADAFRLFSGGGDASIPIGTFGEEAAENFWRRASGAFARPFGGPELSDPITASLLENLGRMVDQGRFSWARPDGLTVYPSAAPAWPVPSVGRRSAADPKPLTGRTDFAATFSAFLEAAPFRVAEGPVPFLIERIGSEARTGWPSRFEPTPRDRIETVFASVAPDVPGPSYEAFQLPATPAATSRPAPTAGTMLAGL